MNHLRQLRREQTVIEAMHRKPFWRVGILHRRPWRSGLKRLNGESLFSWIRSWMFVIHDCKDPAIGCSCSGGFLFPTIETDCPECGGKDGAHRKNGICWVEESEKSQDGTYPS
jgi:hypothetical protein